MTLTKDQKQLARRIGELLALSPLDEDLKEVLLENMDKMPMPALTNLLSMLEKEQAEMEEISADISSFLENQKKNWQELEDSQKALAQKFVEETSRKLTDQIELVGLKKSIDNL